MSIRVAHVATVDLTVRFLLLPQLRRLRDEGYEVAAISAPGPWTGDVEADGIRHITWPHATRAWDPASDARAFLELLGILRREGFDLVHTHNPKPGILGRVAARMAGVPCVVNTVHGLYATPEDSALKRAAVLGLERAAAAFSDVELFQSEEDLRWARRAGVVPPSKSVLLGNGTDVARFDPDAVPPDRIAELRAELGIPDGAVVVGTVGRLVAEKGYRELFAAAREVREEFPEARFVVAGSRDAGKHDAISPEELAAAERDVIVAGWREDVRDLLAVMDVFVLPSWREGVPRSAIEAAAMGRPLVLTDIRGCREVARDGVEGILVPPRDPRRLAAAITDLLRDPGERDRLGKAARARALERFNERRVTDILVATYAEVLARRGRVSPGDERVRVRRARPADAPAIARLHREGLPDAFLPALGDGFLRHLYRALASDRDGVALVAAAGPRVVGFAAGTVSVRRFYRRFAMTRGIPAALSAAPRLIRGDALRRLRETASYPDLVEDEGDSELLSIAVARSWEGRGIGKLLAKGVVDGLARRGAGRVRVVVGADNERANRFYEGMGFTRRRELAVHDGAASVMWEIECRSSSDSGSRPS
jgi:glycosyltransferase involved in cell wall biosynthesis/ribosomal protein S18 acetylase RimI-like enzyme